MKNNDFFSDNPPVTVLEEEQIEFGLNRSIRPKDIAIEKHLHRLGFDKAETILDFGCANGVWLERLIANTDKKGIGVDIADKLIQYANGRPNKKAKYFCTMKKWPLKKSSVDFCFSFDVFEHIKDKKTEAKKIYQTLKKGGKFLIYVIHKKNKYTFDWLFEKLGTDFLYKRADHDKELFADPKVLKKTLENIGFKKVNYELHDGPFNLFWDVFCYAYLGAVDKIDNRRAKEAILDVNDKIVRALYPVNKKLDKITTNRGYSNGFFIWGEK